MTRLFIENANGLTFGVSDDVVVLTHGPLEDDKSDYEDHEKTPLYLSRQDAKSLYAWLGAWLEDT